MPLLIIGSTIFDNGIRADLTKGSFERIEPGSNEYRVFIGGDIPTDCVRTFNTPIQLDWALVAFTVDDPGAPLQGNVTVHAITPWFGHEDLDLLCQGLMIR